MKKGFYFLSLFLLLFIAGNMSVAQAQVYEADMDNPCITSSAQLSSNCTWTPDKGSDNYLPENNEAFYDKGDYLGTLLDGSQSTYWHSEPTAHDYRTQVQWIQIDLQNNDLKNFYFMMQRRADMYNGTERHGAFPSKMIIYGTNDEALASDQNSDMKSWTELVTLSDLPSTDDATFAWPYISTLIQNADGFRYLRIRPTEGLYAYWCPSEIQIYTAKAVTDYHKILSNIVDSIYDAQSKYGIAYTAGTTPGFIPEKALEEYNDQFAAVLGLLDNTSATNDQLIAGIVTLRKIESDIKTKVIPFEEGNYFIRSAFAPFQAQQGVYKQLIVSNGNLTWGTADENNPGQYFIIKKVDGGYSIYNQYTKKYINTGKGDARIGNYSNILVSDTLGAAQLFKPTFDGNYMICNTANEMPYHPIGHLDGAGISGNMVPASVYDDHSKWVLVKADTTGLAEIIAKIEMQAKCDTLADSLLNPRLKSLMLKDPTDKLLTSTDQLSSNCIWQADHDVNLLLDGNHNSYFHSDPNGLNLHKDKEYIQIDLKRDDVKSFTLEYWGRNDGAGTGVSWHDSPTYIIMEGSNNPDDDESWVAVDTLSKSMPANVDDAHYVSPVITANQPYRYWRMVVKETTSTNNYWNISELQLYNSMTAAENSLYSKVAEVKTAVDALDAAIDVAQDHIDNLKVDGTEMDAINAQLAVIDKVLNSKDTVIARVNEANKLYNKLFVFNTNGLITTVNTKNDGTNQLSSNVTWATITPDNDNYSFNQAFIEDGYNLLGTLIDNDDQTYWHSDPNLNLSNTESYLQIDLKRTDVASFRFRIDRRNDLYNGANRPGVPPIKATIYGTNDDAIGTDVNGSCSKWDIITNLEDLPNTIDMMYWPYFSNLITPKTPYRYLRFRCIVAYGNASYWCISGFQVLEGGDASYDKVNSEYYRVDGMKDAADKLQAAITSVQAKLNDNTATLADATELSEAMKPVEDLWQDTAAANKLYNTATTLAENTEVGEYMGQLSDETLLNNLKNTLTTFKPYSSSTATFKANLAALQDAYDKFMAGVNSVEPGKWYYILSATAEDDHAAANYYPERATVTGAALYILNNGGADGKGGKTGNYGPTNQLRWGMDDIKDLPTEGDPDAIWRFVPAPDSIGKGAYFIQNMHTGWYVGDCPAAGDLYYSANSKPLYAFKVVFKGNGEFNIIPVNGNRAGIPISFGDNARQIRGDNTGDGFKTRASLTFQEFSTEDQTAVALQFAANSASIVTLPFAVEDLDMTSSNVKAYSVVGINEDHSAIALQEKNSFAACEPFILVVGDTTEYANNHEATDVYFTLPTDLTVKSDTVNGLIGAIYGASLKTPGYGYINGYALQASTDSKVVSIATHSGYIDPGLISNTSDMIDAWLPLFGKGKLTEISTVKNADANAPVDVYTTDGVLVKHNVAPAEATNGLSKGVYIIGKKKVTVK